MQLTLAQSPPSSSPSKIRDSSSCQRFAICPFFILNSVAAFLLLLLFLEVPSLKQQCKTDTTVKRKSPKAFTLVWLLCIQNDEFIQCGKM